jgi:hypothetical protein
LLALRHELGTSFLVGRRELDEACIALAQGLCQLVARVLGGRNRETILILPLVRASEVALCTLEIALSALEIAARTLELGREARYLTLERCAR